MSEPANDHDSLLPEPDSSETLDIMMKGSGNGPVSRRLLPASLVSVGLHFLFISLFVTVTGTFADPILESAWTAASLPRGAKDDSDYEMALLKRDFPVADVEEVPSPMPNGIVEASPSDLLTIHRLLQPGEADTGSPMKTWIIGPFKFCGALEVAYVIGLAFEVTEIPLDRFRRQDGLSRSKLYLGVDTNANSLMLGGSGVMCEKAIQLVDSLKDSPQTVGGEVPISPWRLLNAIRAIEARKSKPR
jgi:hypothetical protein